MEKNEAVAIGTQSGIETNPYMILGEVYFIQTVTHYYTGRLVWVGEHEIVLATVCWIADTGRFNEFLRDSAKANETEPFPVKNHAIIGRGAIILMTEYADLITTVK